MIACQQPLNQCVQPGQATPTAPITTQMNPLCTSVPHGIEQSTTWPSLQPVLSQIQEKISKGEYIDFTTILPKAMFEVPEPHS